MNAAAETASFLPEPLASPFGETFAHFADSIKNECVICSPYITRGPVEMLLATLDRKKQMDTTRVHFVTDLSLPILVQGATDINALVSALNRLPGGMLTNVPRLHAKVFVSDKPQALVGSANFTDGGAVRNLEYGFRIHEPRMVAHIRADIETYAALGTEIGRERLAVLQTYVEAVREETKADQAALRQKLRTAAKALPPIADLPTSEPTPDASAAPPQTVNALFARAILFFLAGGPLTTDELNARIQVLHPELCDDTYDRIINGKHFGKKWKHQIRGAQVFLHRKGAVSYDKVQKVWAL